MLVKCPRKIMRPDPAPEPGDIPRPWIARQDKSWYVITVFIYHESSGVIRAFYNLDLAPELVAQQMSQRRSASSREMQMDEFFSDHPI